ncbi:sugar ABC transporter substrate-binding protein [Isoptericola sp. b441]|uniref:Sugar ABC transporter substrate-binding protein n=1 Tax=Actinotalea lenta TaxID=3064654 RepID=A0ABT9D8L9_9CELL|nr:MULTISPECIES: multiple monosaccharide ABC transporter substrate-binding protein [unclassified Isoptericola]MDO8106478.1 sugar ABC transporter substrate-binding protein [Isoptericola sp. b441]MDO8121806.1 sugar ABC transporter substrate-binding protein [Isoptericola sp. b490]
MKLKKFVAVAAGLTMAMSLAACGGGGAGSTDTSSSADTSASSSGGSDSAGGLIGVAMPTQTSSRWIADGNAVKKGLEDLGYTVDLEYANDDIPTQQQQVDQMITKGAKALIIAAIDGTTLTGQLQTAADKGIPIISYDRLIRNSENVDFYVTFDNYKVGVQQATSLLVGLGILNKDGSKGSAKGPFNIELFAGSLDDNNAYFFFNGAMDTLKPYLDDGTLVVKSGQTDIKQVNILRWQQETAQKRMEDLLTSTYNDGSKVQGVLSPYDGLSRGIIQALMNAGYPKTISDGFPIVTGQDAEIESVKLIADDVQFSTIFKDTRLLANEAVKVAQAYLEGKTPEANDTKTYDNGKKVVPSYLLESVIIYKDNIQKELVDSGYWTADEVASGVAKG